MSEDQQPDLQWAPLPAKRKNRGRAWLIVGLVVAALAIVGVLLFFLLPRGDAPDPGPSVSPSASPTTTATPIPSATPEPTSGPDEPVVTEPPIVDPTVDAFRDRVSVWLDDASRGLDIVATANSADATAVIDSLQEDAQRLSDTTPPSAIAAEWGDDVQAYAQRLATLRSAVAAGSGVPAAVDGARSSLQSLNALIGG